jgi:acyl CoA:acetate/3-ketoacid CoA transferase beta subunit
MTNRYTRDQIAARVAQDIHEGAYVNLGIGLPTKVANYLPPTAKSSCTAKTACSAWARRRRPARKTKT